MTKTRWTLLVVAMLVLSLATGGYAVSGFKKQMGRHGKEMIKEHILSKVDYTVQELKLTPGQQEQYSAIRGRMSTEMDSISKRHNSARDAIHTEMAKVDPDIKGMADKMKGEIEAMSGAVTTQIDYLMEVYDILDANQKKQLTALLKDRMARHHDDHDDYGH